MSYTIISVDQFKTYQKGQVGSDLDDVIVLLNTYVTSRFEQYCERQFDKKSYTAYQSFARARRSFFVKNFPIALDPLTPFSPLISIWEDPARAYPADTLLDASLYVVTPEIGKIERVATDLAGMAIWMLGVNAVKVTYTGGYLEGDGVGAPGDLSMAALLQAGFLYQRRGEIGLNSRSLEGGSFTTESKLTLLPEVRDILDLYGPQKLTVI